MSTPSKYTARELARELRRYGDAVVGLVIVDDQDREHEPTFNLRLELHPNTSAGMWLAITGYEDAS